MDEEIKDLSLLHGQLMERAKEMLASQHERMRETIDRVIRINDQFLAHWESVQLSRQYAIDANLMSSAEEITMLKGQFTKMRKMDNFLTVLNNQCSALFNGADSSEDHAQYAEHEEADNNLESDFAC